MSFIFIYFYKFILYEEVNNQLDEGNSSIKHTKWSICGHEEDQWLNIDFKKIKIVRMKMQMEMEMFNDKILRFNLTMECKINKCVFCWFKSNTL